MATIHSLPTELIRDVLLLTYPPGAEGSGAGLCLTALVHSSWKEPSQSVMTEWLLFIRTFPDSARKFVESGPWRAACAVLEVERCSNEQLRAILAKVKPNSVSKVALSTYKDPLPTDLFAIPALIGVRSLSLQAPPNDDGFLTLDNDIIDFTPVPTGLQGLTLAGRVVTPSFVAASAETLCYLNLGWDNDHILNHLPVIGPRFSQLQFLILRVDLNYSLLGFDLPDNILPALLRLPSLAHLELLGPTAHQLQNLFDSLPDLPCLCDLTTALLLPFAEPERIVSMRLHYPDMARLQDEFVPALQHCAGRLRRGRLGVWRLGVGLVRDSGREQLDEAGFSEWAETLEGWNEFKKEVQAAGVELELGEF